jgi:SlyX protein
VSTGSPDSLRRAEERIAWLERHVTAQDKAMLEMADALKRLTDEVRRLRDRGEAPDGAATPVDDKPPHY